MFVLHLDLGCISAITCSPLMGYILHVLVETTYRINAQHGSAVKKKHTVLSGATDSKGRAFINEKMFQIFMKTKDLSDAVHNDHTCTSKQSGSSF